MDADAKDATDSAGTVDAADVTADAVVDAVTADAASATTAVCGSSFFFAAAADGAIMDSDAAVAVMAATVADADICSFFHFEWGMRKNRMPHSK